MPSVSADQAASTQGLRRAAKAASILPSASAAMAKQKATENPT